MLFSSLSFLLLFLPILVIAYYLSSSTKIKNLVIFLFSLFFYSWGEPVYIFLMIFSIAMNYLLAILIHRYKKMDRLVKSKFVFISSIIVNIGILVFFKYSNFIILNINSILKTNIRYVSVLLPIGVSFYTFQIVSYIIDVYWGKVDVQENIIYLGAYIVLFPQLIAGPIVRYETIEKELSCREISVECIYSGLTRFIIGLGKKVIIANQIGLIADKILITNPHKLGMQLAWLGLVSYTLQIYFDFSGYSDMAIGLGKILGFTFLENFNYPYMSRSITEFWRRWHISLGTWFRDYLYIPLGGNRVSKLRWILNILIVWVLTGLWHGASWNFVIWGLYYGFILVFERLILYKINLKIFGFLGNIYTILLVMIGWTIFKIETFKGAGRYIKALLGLYGTSSWDTFHNIAITNLLIFVPIGLIGATPLIGRVLEHLDRNTYLSIIKDIFVLLIFLISFLFLINSSFNPFIYFRF